MTVATKTLQNRKPSSLITLETSSEAPRDLTPHEIELLRQDALEMHEWCKKRFAHVTPLP